MDAKPFYQSKLFWLGLITVIVGAAPLVVELVQTIVPDTQTVTTAVGSFVVGVLTIILRVYFTDTKIE
jgi:hypothetical protein